jgi:hypothetical protein
VFAKRTRGQMLEPADARIEACVELTTLERWLDQAITTTSVAAAIG